MLNIYAMDGAHRPADQARAGRLPAAPAAARRTRQQLQLKPTIYTSYTSILLYMVPRAERYRVYSYSEKCGFCGTLKTTGNSVYFYVPVRDADLPHNYIPERHEHNSTIRDLA